MIRAIPAISRSPLAWLERAVSRWGDLVALPILGPPVLLANTPDAARHVLQANHRNYTKATIQYGALSAVTGLGLLTSDGPDWRRHRRAVQPAFHAAVLPDLARTTLRAASAPGLWDGAPFGADPAGQGAGRLVDADAAAMRVMLDVVTACLFSQSAGPDGQRVINAVDAALQAVVARARSPLVGPLARIPTPAQRRQRRAVQTLDHACRELIAHRRAVPDPVHSPGSAGPVSAAGPGAVPQDLLGLLLQAQDAGVLTGTEVRDELVTMIIAGHETVASSLTWTLALLADDPRVQDRLHAELDLVLAGGSPGWDDLPALPYLRAVVRESLRLYPPAWVITRRAVGPDLVAGVRVPAGTLIILSPWLLHRRSEDWPQPLRFDPERFLVDAGRRDGYLPFGAGPRLCIGRDLALMQATLVLAQLLREHQVRRPPGTAAPAVDALVTLRPKGGLPLVISSRPGRSAAS